MKPFKPSYKTLAKPRQKFSYGICHSEPKESSFGLFSQQLSFLYSLLLGLGATFYFFSCHCLEKPIHVSLQSLPSTLSFQTTISSSKAVSVLAILESFIYKIPLKSLFAFPFLFPFFFFFF